MDRSIKAHRELIQIGSHESFLVFDRVKDEFDYPIHFHPEYELNFIHRGDGLRRVVGSNMEEISSLDLVLIGANIPHCWEQHNCTNKGIHEITLQFRSDLFDANILQKTLFKPINDMLERSKNGIVFSEETCKGIIPRLEKLSKIEGIDYFLEIISILYDLAISRNQRILTVSYQNGTSKYDQRLDRFYNHIQNNFARKISLAEVAELTNMSKVSLNRFIKKSTGKTFVEYLNEVRIGYASRWLVERDDSISEIAFDCGFNNLANFNRMFKKSQGCTPTEYRDDFLGIKRVL
ncbi:AraC family transcriptional regulator [Croceivirga thetidis]|uniref:Helix-turn-helix transcriptional regulator n=1 Tax=Croceivirga thetidis TaxID=2721623 RepID=A0ABX1GTL9_9FLAO|nr:AraC family transcriptional regulator [Croceivirga thetidis]NKI33302.1 helix-turn-helix transcriptional regulator [Croceivirga thetidis]